MRHDLLDPPFLLLRTTSYGFPAPGITWDFLFYSAEEVIAAIKKIGINRCARESGFDRKNFIRKLIRGTPVKRTSYTVFAQWLQKSQ
jgi:hypothetical protein